VNTPPLACAAFVAMVGMALAALPLSMALWPGADKRPSPH